MQADQEINDLLGDQEQGICQTQTHGVKMMPGVLKPEKHQRK
jgi:hypothetical protein